MNILLTPGPDFAGSFQTTRTRAELRAGRDDWYRVVAKDKKEGDKLAKIYIYDEIGYFGTRAQDLAKEVKELDAEKIEVHLNSPGGAAFDGVAIYNVLKSHAAEVEMHVDGIAASAATIIAMAGDKVIMHPGAMMMVHQASAYASGNAQFLRDRADMLDKLNGEMAALYSFRAGGSKDQWLRTMETDTWFTAEEAVEAGLADEEMTPGSNNDDDDDAATAFMQKTFDMTMMGVASEGASPKELIAELQALRDATSTTTNVEPDDPEEEVENDLEIDQVAATVNNSTESDTVSGNDYDIRGLRDALKEAFQS